MAALEGELAISLVDHGDSDLQQPAAVLNAGGNGKNTNESDDGADVTTWSYFTNNPQFLAEVDTEKLPQEHPANSEVKSAVTSVTVDNLGPPVTITIDGSSKVADEVKADNVTVGEQQQLLPAFHNSVSAVMPPTPTTPTLEHPFLGAPSSPFSDSSSTLGYFTTGDDSDSELLKKTRDVIASGSGMTRSTSAVQSLVALLHAPDRSAGVPDVEAAESDRVQAPLLLGLGSKPLRSRRKLLSLFSLVVLLAVGVGLTVGLVVRSRSGSADDANTQGGSKQAFAGAQGSATATTDATAIVPPIFGPPDTTVTRAVTTTTTTTR
ncbi:hypothetical protein HDU93_000416 [Gonapodya sp. JEL0774]|nr:hypothetical protein HDU93_000416 [Gonapodya sp. JEL0774]